jgi:DNA-binding NtrC family response regulator
MHIISSKSPSLVGAPLEQTSFVVASRAMTELVAMAEGAARSPATVLITGESGVGKDLVARYVHSHSSRRLAPFAAVNCAGLTEARFESELFGRVNENMTSAWPDKRGKLRLAHRGTLFLDEVADMNLHMQGWLLRFLEHGEIQTVGSNESQARVDVRVVATTNRDLNDLVAAGQFREDLLYRLRVIHLHVPPLRERAEDVHALMKHFLAVAARDLSFTDDALRAFLKYRWPGNVRELRNVVEQLVWLSADGLVGVEHLPVSMHSGLPPLSSVTTDWEEELAPAIEITSSLE